MGLFHNHYKTKIVFLKRLKSKNWLQGQMKKHDCSGSFPHCKTLQRDLSVMAYCEFTSTWYDIGVWHWEIDILRHTYNYAKWSTDWRQKNSGIKSCMRLSASLKLSPIGCPEDLSQKHKSLSWVPSWWWELSPLLHVLNEWALDNKLSLNY